MIVFDLSAIAHNKIHSLDDDSIELLRHAMLNSIGYTINELRTNNRKEEIVIACDSRNNWRKDVFPHYKARRKDDRKNNTKIDWENFFTNLNTLIEEFKHNMPFKVLTVNRAEADDIIYAVCKYRRSDERIIIVSPDKDFRQLCNKSNNVKLYWSKPGQTYIDFSDYDLFTHIIKGDSSDGIPNVLSEDNVFVERVKQTVLSAKKKQTLIDYRFNLDEAPIINDDIKKRIEKNRQLIDLNQVPKELVDEILTAYDECEIPRGKMFNYMVVNRLTKLMSNGVFK